MFGQSSTPFGSPQGGFGQSNTAPGGFGSTNPSTFGAPAPAPTGFGGFGSSPAPAPTGFGGFGQAPAPAAFGSGTGGFGAPSPTPGFGVSTGGFGAAPSSSLFGMSPAPAPTGGLFGSAPSPSAFGSQPTNTAFGGGGVFGSASNTTPGFGSSTTTSAFGAAPATGGGLFGSISPAPAPIGFGSTSTGFGAPTTNVFGANSPAPAGGLFGAAPAAPAGGLFGSSPATGMSSAPGSGGTKMIPFQPTNRQDGTSNITLLSITAMQNYENKSFEELRYEDYSQGNKGTGSQTGAVGGFGAPSAFGGAPAPATSLFGGTPAPAPFGAPSPATGGFGFGSPAPAPFGAPAPAGAFGTTSTFGAPAPTSGLFGSPTPAPGLFGSSPAPPPAGGLFGSAPAPASTGFGSAPAFGAPPAPGLFGQTPAPAPSTGLFGSTPAPTTAFGTTGAFGSSTSSGGFGTFGAPAPASGGLFGSAPAPAFGSAPSGGGLFGTATPAPSAGGFFGAKPPGTTGLFGSQPTPAPGGFGVTPQVPYGGYSQQPQAPVMVAPPPVGTVMPPATNEIMASQLAALESKRKELEQADNFRSKPTESPSITAISLGERESSSLVALTPMRATYFAHRPSPRSSAKIRPRGFASPTDKSTAMIGPQSLSKLGSGGKPMAAPETVAAASATRLIIAPSPKPKLRLTLGSNGDSHNGQQLRQQETTPLKLPGGSGIAETLGSLKSKDSPGIRSEPGSAQGRTDASPMNGSSPVVPGGRAYEYYQQVIGSVDDELNGHGEKNRVRSGQGDIAPKLSKAGYTCNPPIATLQAMEPVDLAAVPEFSVQRAGVGKIAWEGAVDVRGADLDRIVVIEPKSVSVYTEEEEKGTKPHLGTKLNRPAILTLEGVFPPEGGGPESTQRFIRKVAKQTMKMDAELINYDPTTGEWILRVHHFSKYGLDDDDHDSDADELDAPVKDDQGLIHHMDGQWDFHSGEREGRSPATIGILKKHRKFTPYKPSRGFVLLDVEDQKVDSVELVNDVDMFDERRVMEEAETAFNNMQLRLENESRPARKMISDEGAIFPEESVPFWSNKSKKTTRYVYDAHDLEASSSMASISLQIARGSSVRTSQTDFGLRMGRSFRVAWSPDGSFLKLAKDGVILTRSRPKFSESGLEDEKKLLETQRPHCEKVQVEKERCKLISLTNFSLGGNPLKKTLESYADTGPVHSATGRIVAKSVFSLLKVLQETMSARKDDRESGVFGNPSQSNEEDLDNRVMHAIGSWLVDSCADDVRAEIHESKQKHEMNKALLSAVSGGDLRLASSIAIQCGQDQLSILLVSGIEANKDVLQQIDEWRRNGLARKIPKELFRAYCMIAGDQTMEESMYKDMKTSYEFDWKRRMAMKMAYCNSQNPNDISTLIQRYEVDVGNGVAPFPAPTYDKSDSSVPSILFSLLKLSTQSSVSTLATTVNPLGYTNNPHDYSLSFHVASLISALGFSEPLGAEEEYNLVDGFAAQLCAHGFWYWSVYVVLYLFDRSQTSREWKIKHAKTLVLRNYDGLNVEARDFLEDLSVPSQWFEEALAFRCALAGDTHGYLRHMIQVDTSKLSKAVEKILVPNTLFLSGEKLEDMLQLLKIFASSEDACLATAVFDFFEIHRTIQMLNGKSREEIDAAVPALLEACDEVEKAFVAQQSDNDIEFVPDTFVVPMASFLAEGLSQISLFKLQVLALQSGHSVYGTASQMLKLVAKQDIGTMGFADRENICRWLM